MKSLGEFPEFGKIQEFCTSIFGHAGIRNEFLRLVDFGYQGLILRVFGSWAWKIFKAVFSNFEFWGKKSDNIWTRTSKSSSGFFHFGNDFLHQICRNRSENSTTLEMPNFNPRNIIRCKSKETILFMVLSFFNWTFFIKIIN